MLDVLVDTNVLIDYSHGQSELLDHLLRLQEKGDVMLFVNPIVIAEYLTDSKLKNENALKDTLEFLAFFNIVDITKKDGLLAGEILREKTLPFIADALIAATCIGKGLKLATRNKKHFSKVTRLKFLTID